MLLRQLTLICLILHSIVFFRSHYFIIIFYPRMHVRTVRTCSYAPVTVRYSLYSFSGIFQYGCSLAMDRCHFVLYSSEKYNFFHFSKLNVEF